MSRDEGDEVSRGELVVCFSEHAADKLRTIRDDMLLCGISALQKIPSVTVTISPNSTKTGRCELGLQCGSVRATKIVKVNVCPK